MEAWLLREWQRGSFWQVFLRPLSWFYAAVTAMRRKLYRAGLLRGERVGVPVIVVGNITVGGTGKTPVVLALAQHLTAAGRHCGIISRGYARSEAAATAGMVIHVVPEAIAGEVKSDEATLLASRSGLPVYVSSNRPAAARQLLKEHPQVDTLICDDGLQHYALHRDIELCVVDGARGFGNGGLLPAGPLREPVSRLNDVDAVIINGEDLRNQVHAATRLLVTAPTVFPLRLGNETLIRVADGKEISIADGLREFAGKSITAIAGTGNPGRFFDQLHSLGFRCAATQAFPDHHAFSATDLLFADAGIILMTEKDAVKCSAFADERMWFMRVDAILPDAFGEWILERLNKLERHHVT